MSQTERTNLLDFDRAGLEAFFADRGEKGFRASQVLQWVHRHGVTDFEQMTNLSQKLRTALADEAEFTPPRVISTQVSTDGTRKWLLDVGAGNGVETVYIPEGERGTLCVSSQVGCSLTCSFCATGRQGFNRNLSSGEILIQLWHAQHELMRETGRDRPITNVVFMGMGEPLLNFDNLVSAIDLMLDDLTYGLSKWRVTVSTSGVVPYIDRLRERRQVALAVSLHAPEESLRDKLMPINQKYPLSELMAACHRYVDADRRHSITFEYTMLAGINDSPEQARALARLLGDLPCKLNLIPFNPFPGAPYECSDPATISRFSRILRDRGYVTTTRKTRGDDIAAACGQLAGQVDDRSRRVARWQGEQSA
ncbi:MAG: 23S rRNA (adenine(2503)-C(2))-methyltransferase RlmN [Gammaproteobacteria bacterium]|nr:23S rRNA (adenine(2503)-C(2))-methyltransferase RlmN [Gammaproteobacteria bacterium]